MNVQNIHTADAVTAEEGLAIQEEQAKLDSGFATDVAMQNTLLTPRFYTTDFDELDAIDVSPVREDWDELERRLKQARAANRSVREQPRFDKFQEALEEGRQGSGGR